MHRPTLGVVAGLFLVAGVVVSFVSDLGIEDDRFWGGVLLRMGAVLGALWLVLPRARRLSWRTWTAVTVFVVVVAARPRLVLYAFGISVVILLYELIMRARAKDERGP